MKGEILMKSKPNSNSMHNLMNDFDSLSPLSPEILHKKNVNAYIHNKHKKNMNHLADEFEPEFEFTFFKSEKNGSDSPITFENESEYDYEFMDNFLSGVSSKHAGDEYSPQYDLQSAVESRLQEKNNFENSDENQL